MSKPRVEMDQRLADRMVILVTKEFKDEYNSMCQAMGENASQHIRTTWELELALWKASKEK